MEHAMHQKAEFPAVYVDESRAAVRKAKLRRFMSTIVKLVFMSLFLGVCLALAYQSISDKRNYDNLLSKYNSATQDIKTADYMRSAALRPRAAESGSLSYTYTTTTLTKGTTITLTATPSTTMAGGASAVPSANASVISNSATGCGTVIPPIILTVTVHDSTVSGSSSTSIPGPVSSVPSILASSPIPFSTRITTTTILVTASSSAPPQTQTATLTSTDVIVVTATEVTTAGASASSGSSISTSESTIGSLSAPSHFPNSSSTAYGSAFATTVNYTMTVPPLGTGTAKLLTAHGTTTSRSDPVNTVLSASGGRTAVRDSAIMLTVVLMAFLAHI